jgi:hypothetical protein
MRAEVVVVIERNRTGAEPDDPARRAGAGVSAVIAHGAGNAAPQQLI